MSLSILSVAYPFTPVGDDAVGGSEQILTLLDRALTRAGHKSYVLAVEGSRVRGKLLPSPYWQGELDGQARDWGVAQHRRLLERACHELPIDVVHMHGLDFWRYLPESPIPVLATLHLPPEWYPPHIWNLPRPHTWLNCVSSRQQQGCPPGSVSNVCPNGIDCARFALRRKRGYVLSLGRVCPEKGYHVALDAARRAGCSLLLAGDVKPMALHQKYFQEEIVPRLDSHRRFLGPVGFIRKRNLLAGATCLLIPSLVAETSSLVAMEALASGTPVVAFPNGALPEIIEHGRTGYLVHGVEEMAEAIQACRQLSPVECRKAAEERFSVESMVNRYLDLYSGILFSLPAAAMA